MNSTEFSAALKEQMQRYEHFRQDAHKLNTGNEGGWNKKEPDGQREGYTVQRRDQYFALKWTVLENDSDKGSDDRVIVLILPISNRNEIAGPNQSVTLRSNSEEGGNFFINVTPNKQRSTATLRQAFGNNTEFPRYEKGRILVGPITAPEFLARVLDVAAVSDVGESEIDRPPQFWAGGKDWEDTSMEEEFTSNNYWKPGWKIDDENPTAQECWAFFRQVRVGDWFAMKGYGGTNNLRIYYVGRVTEINPETGELKLQREDVPLFRDKAPKIGKGGNWRKTLTPVLSPEAIEMIFGIKTQAEDTLEGVSNMPAIDQYALNTILYGPPGTGKTYQALARAVSIAEPSVGEVRGDVQSRFRMLCSEGRVAFITFHQSYSYEDFIEGIRPVLSDEEERGARYELVSGIFKRIAIDATFDCLERVADAAAVDFDARWDALLQQIELEPDRTYSGLTQNTEFSFEVSRKGNLSARNIKASSSTNLYCGREQARKVYLYYPNPDQITCTQVFSVIGRGCHAHLIAPVVKLLKSIQGTPQEQVPDPLPTDKAEIVKRFLDVGEASGYRLKDRAEWKPFVLLIDEINRGNISKIFGELITLLEPDKRLGEPVEIVATLPYSGERFVAPPNLFVLGTMNTADKSLALLDLALRRRFEFEELQPDFSSATCPCGSLPRDLRLLLEELNRRITLRKDRDHLIGHAYFMGVRNEADFDRVFERRVIPLLQEYFFNDWDGLRAVLGEDVSANACGFIRPLERAKSPWARNQWQWFHDCGATIQPHALLRANYQYAPASADVSLVADPNN